MEKDQSFFYIKDDTLICQGEWTILSLPPSLEDYLSSIDHPVKNIDARPISRLDSAGVEFIQEIQKRFSAAIQLSDEQKRLCSLIGSYTFKPTPIETPKKLSGVEELGQSAYRGYLELLKYFEFIGEVFVLMFSWIFLPQRILWRNIAKVLESAGYYGLPIIGLLSFLIGVVLAYQMGVQLKNYGANIFVVNLLGISILREFAPLITAIIVAGRTGSAFTAELGTMKVNQELDALTTMGVKPLEYLVTPKILGLIIAMPLLSMWASFTGIFGGMIMSKSMLDITFIGFWHQFHTAVGTKQLWIGLMKTPVFAFIISSVGCFQGFEVSGGAESVGKQTTRSVVQALFLIIVADAFFSILLSILHA